MAKQFQLQGKHGINESPCVTYSTEAVTGDTSTVTTFN